MVWDREGFQKTWILLGHDAWKKVTTYLPKLVGLDGDESQVHSAKKAPRRRNPSNYRGPTWMSMEVIVTIVSKLVYNLLKGLITYL